MNFAHWLGSADVALCVGEYVGLRAAHRCKVASLASCRILTDVCVHLKALFPSTLYVCGAQYLNVISAETFDLSTGLWRSLPPTLINHSIANAVVAALAGRLFVAETDTTTAEWYDPESQTWALLPPMLISPRREVVHAVLGGKLYLCGGSWVISSWQALNAAFCFDPDTISWETLPSMLVRRSGPGIASMGGNLYVCGGHGDSEDCLHSVERFDPYAGSWEQLQPMFTRRWKPAMTVASNKLYACGGCTNDSSGNNRRSIPWPTRSVERYDAAANAWEHVHSMSMPRQNPTVATFHGNVYICSGRLCGGEDRKATYLKSVERYSIQTNSWANMPPMSVPRWGPAIAVLGEKMYVCGGYNARALRRALKSVDIFNSETDRWEHGSPMEHVEGNVTAVLLRQRKKL